MHEILKNKKGVLFDIGWTLDQAASGDWMITNRVLELVGRERMEKISRAEIDAAIAEGVRMLAKNHRMTGREEEEKQFTAFYRLLNERLGWGLNGDQLADAAHDRTYNLDNYVFYDDAEPVVRALSKIMRVGILSDTWPSAWQQLDKGGFRDCLTSVTFSSDVGYFKPDPRIFEDALQKIGLAAEDVAFVDDTPLILEGAEKLGITPVLIASHAASDVPTRFTKIHSLSELIR